MVLSPKFHINETVRLRRDAALVGIVRQIGSVVGGVQWYSIFFGGVTGTQRYSEEDLEYHVEDAGPKDNLAESRFAGYADLQRLITYQRILRDDPLSNNLYAFNASRTRFYPYQFKPLLKFLASPRHRLLIADEVGLGKTIEAGLILTELRARQSIRRVLIVCPSNLTDKWKMELKRRFDEDFQKYNSREFLSFLKEYEENPDRLALSGIISIESIRRQEVLDAIKAVAPDLDLVIVDEAHHMRNFGKLQRMAGVQLSQNASAMLMLTATPVHLGSENLFSLLNILDADDFADLASVSQRFRDNEPIVKAQNHLGQIPPRMHDARTELRNAAQSPFVAQNPLLHSIYQQLDELEKLPDGPIWRRRLSSIQKDLSELNLIGHIFSRTRKRQVQEGVAQRHAYALEIELSPAEQAFYEAVTDYVRAESAARTDVPIIQKWLLNTPQRRVASSIPAMVAHYKRDGMSGCFGLTVDLQEDDFDDLAEQQLDSLPYLERTRAKLGGILANWPQENPDAKYQTLKRVLKEIKAEEGKLKVLLFAFFKDTLGYLHSRLTADGFNACIISGNTPINERYELIQRFRENDKIEIMLSSRVGSEGLDFQFCNIMFNYDLPWNPMDVEQRIGRLDRIGQESPIIRIYNFWIKGTIEERILRRLYDRIHLFERSIGELELILGDRIKEIEQTMLSAELSPQEMEVQVARTALIIETRMQQLEQLEEQSAIFIGTDAFFEEEVEQIRQKKRFVTGEQIFQFLKDFIQHNCPRTRLIYDLETMEGKLIPDQEFRRFVIDQGITHEMARFLNDNNNGVAITFNSGTAYRLPNNEFINVLHPMIRAIAAFYSRQANEDTLFKNTHHIVLSYKNAHGLTPGFYLYFIYIFRIQAARPVKTLEMVLLREDLSCACDMELAELILGEMVENGRDAVGATLELEREFAEEATQLAEQVFLEYIEATRRQVEWENELYVRRRLGSLEQMYKKNITVQQELLNRGQRERRDPRYLRLREGTIRRLENELNSKRKQIEDQRMISVSNEDLAAGILQVI